MTSKKIILFIISFLMVSLGNTTWAQHQEQKFKLHKATAQTYLHDGKYANNSTITVAQFEEQLNHPLEVKDSLGRVFPVTSYSFIYLNRGVFVDSAGHPIILTTPLSVRSNKGFIPSYWLKGLKPQLKGGDTAIFTNIRYYPKRIPSISDSILNHIDSSAVVVSKVLLMTKDSTKAYPLLYGTTLKVILK